MNSDSNKLSTARAFDGMERFEAHFGSIVFSAGLVIRLALIHAFPPIYGVDSVARLVNNDKILLAHQLPLLQAAIYVLAKITEGALAVRYFVALAGALAGLGAYKLGADLLGQPGGFAVGLLFATQPFVLLYSIVPYQEILMLGGLLFALHYFLSDRSTAASFCLALACFSRYEAWIACPVLATAFVREHGGGAGQIPRAALLFGWAPLIWVAFQGGLSPAGTAVLAASFSVEKFYRYLYLGYIGLTNTPVPVLLLALVGVWQVRKLQLWRVRGFLLPGVFVLIFLVAVLFTGHGVRDQPDRYTTSREAHIPIVAGVFLAGAGLLRLPRYRNAALGVSLAAGIMMAAWFVHRDSSAPRLRLSYETARYLDCHVLPSERAAVLAKPLPAQVLANFLRDAQERGGESEVRQAANVLRAIDASPLDSQRVLVHSRLGRERLISLASFVWPEEFRRFEPRASKDYSSPGPESIQWVAVWSDFEPSNEAERALAARIADATPRRILKDDGAAVRLYHLE